MVYWGPFEAPLFMEGSSAGDLRGFAISLVFDAAHPALVSRVDDQAETR